MTCQFAFSLVVSGLSIGLMYSLIALGFVLVYKATDAINFAQGEFVMLAGFVAALRRRRQGMPIVAAIYRGGRGHGRCSASRWSVSFCGRSRTADRRRHHGDHRAGRHPARPAAHHGRRGNESLVAADRRRADRIWPGHRCRPSRCWAWSSRWCSSVPSPGSSSRAGWAWRCAPWPTTSRWRWPWASTCERYFALAWAMAGIVSALGGVIWGSMLGVDTHLALVGLKVFPVVILGGLDFDRRRGHRRPHRRRGGKHRGWLPRSLSSAAAPRILRRTC